VTAATKFECAFSATIPTCCLKTAAICLSLGLLHLDPVPECLPRFGGALHSYR
jgi:hypothetical protein